MRDRVRDLRYELIKTETPALSNTELKKFFFLSLWCFIFVLLKPEAASLQSFHVFEWKPIWCWCSSTVFFLGFHCLAVLPEFFSSPLLCVCLPPLSYVKPQDAHTQLGLVRTGCLLERCVVKQKHKWRMMDAHSVSLFCFYSLYLETLLNDKIIIVE